MKRGFLYCFSELCAITEDVALGLVSEEGLPSGQRQQTVNLPAYAFVGSNPTSSTVVRV